MQILTTRYDLEFRKLTVYGITRSQSIRKSKQIYGQMILSSPQDGFSKLKKRLRGGQRWAHILVWQRVRIMKLLHDSIYDPSKQTKKTLWCFARLTINSDSGCFRRFSGKFLKQTERLKRHSYFNGWKLPGGNSDFMSSNLFWILVSGFRGRFSLNETDLGKW